jgi:hypothetical protein
VSIFSTYWLVKKIDMTQSAMAHLDRQSEMPLRIASLNFEFCTFALRHRTSSSRQRARPTPGTGRGVEGSALMRQRVLAAVGCLNSAAWAWRRQRRSARPITPESSAAS